MLPAPSALAPLDPRKTRALTTIYAPRKFKTRKNKTAQARMLDDVPVKPTLSPFHPLPAIGQKPEKVNNTKVILFDLNKNDRTDAREEPLKIRDMLQPLTPLRIHGFIRQNSLDHLDSKKKPQQLVRENTYDVIEPIYLSAVKVRKRDSSVPRKMLNVNHTENKEEDKSKLSPKTRFRKAAMQVAKLSSLPETGKLLCLRERQTFNICLKEDDNKSTCKLQILLHSPTEKLDKLSEIFQTLEMNGRHRDKMKKENSWF